jgi:translation initiation factor 2 subunit 1
MGKLVGFPEEGELVVGTVAKVENFGAFVKLEEYPGKEGFIHVAEVAPGWVKYIRDYVRENQKIVTKVMSVHTKKGHIDLSLKQVNEHQRREKIQQWKNEQRAEKLFELIAERSGITPDHAWEEFGNRLVEEFGTLYGALEEVALNSKVLADEGFEGVWTENFIQVAQDSIVPPTVEIRGYFKLGSISPNGVDVIREALKLADKVEDDEITINVQYLGAPRYGVQVKALNYKDAEEELKLAQDRVIGYMTEHGGEGSFHRTET